MIRKIVYSLGALAVLALAVGAVSRQKKAGSSSTSKAPT